MLSFVEHVLAKQTVEELWAFHTETMAEFGFNRLLYGFTNYRTTTSLGNAEDFLILTNHDPAYIRPFLDEGMYLQAPTVRWALDNTGALSWRQIADRPENLTAEEAKVIAFNRAHGVNAGYTVSFKGVSIRSVGAVGLVADESVTQAEVDALWQRHGRRIVAMNNIAHLRIVSMPLTVARKKLTERQRETLEWVAAGKTTADIATIMGLNPATVEKHLRLARKVLDVGTTAQAVLKASFQNQIFVVAS